MIDRSILDSKPAGFEGSVFINCPFDEEYKEFLRPLLFAIVYFGFAPKISTERSDSGEYRLSKICELIVSAQFSIHDLSRNRADAKGDFARMNMPFELGVDYGTRLHGPDYATSKQFLILEAKRHQYKISLSDLSGVDIKVHGNNASDLTRCVRDWFYETVGRKDLEPPTVVWTQFNDFIAWLFEKRLAAGLPEDDVTEDIEKMSNVEYVDELREWISDGDLKTGAFI